MRKLALTGALVASLCAANVAGAQPYHHHHHHRRYAHCRYERHRNGAIGAVAGAIGGGIIGSALTHGRAGGTLLGAGAGAFTGHALATSSTHC
jgi:uncharacterized protein YcfJ